MSEPTPEESREHMRTLVNGIRERDAVIKELLAQLPSDGQGRWRQGTKNPRNLYVHQGDDKTGQPVGQMYSAQLAALVCDAVNAGQVAEDLMGRLRQDHRAELAEAEKQIQELGVHLAARDHALKLVGEHADAVTAERDDYADRLRAVDHSWAELAAERDQLKLSAQVEIEAANRWMAEANRAEAAIARVGALATSAARTECGAGWNLDPAEVLAALDQSKEPT